MIRIIECRRKFIFGLVPLAIDEWRKFYIMDYPVVKAAYGVPPPNILPVGGGDSWDFLPVGWIPGNYKP